jgi:hypothetical protein
MIRIGICVIVLLAFGLLKASANESILSIQNTGTQIQILENRKLIAAFQTKSTDPKNHPARMQYLHPIITPGGEVMTEDMPADHLHQRGVYWAWRQILLNGQQVGNSWTLENIRFEVVSQKAAIGDGETAVIRSEILWKVYIGGAWVSLVSEAATIVIAPLQDGARQMTFEVDLQALLKGVSIGGAPNSKGYGGMSVRFKDALAMRFYNAAGADVKPTLNPVTEAGVIVMNWDQASDLSPYMVSMSCEVGGHAIDKWILRRELSMQNCVWPGQNPVELSTQKPTQLKSVIMVGLLD